MQNQSTQPDFVSNACRTISGQLAEWGIAFSQDRVAQLKPDQRNELQNWINASVDADEEYREAIASLPEFMESELLEMCGALSNEGQETIIEQAINAYEADAAITENPYLFDTNAWHLWRAAFCRWHHGEPLDFPGEQTKDAIEIENQNLVSEIQQTLIQIAPQLSQAERTLKQICHQLKQQVQLTHQLCESFESSAETVPAVEENVSLNHEKEDAQKSSRAAPTTGYSSIVRIPVTGPETNRVEVYLLQDNQGQWRAGHLWSVEADLRTGQLSRGSRQPDQQQIAYPTETEALINEVISLSQSLIGVPEIERQIIDYLNLLEEFPGQIAVCRACQRHYIDDGLSETDCCPTCFEKLDSTAKL
ncbi:hypothetical protein [Gimesia fumaroli]|jgi:hypothetical protein|uniref:Uncharacterized protein n=1 Tax=Gimesia fumaroli TaxID=2527976 RepID=A0A518IL48_9PLAN|nr:hypothetical protein [Gimesia fumaroli]QDV53822.1 hypothetical protein Enr17x_59050 [Gimesia fumaroli]